MLENVVVSCNGHVLQKIIQYTVTKLVNLKTAMTRAATLSCHEGKSRLIKQGFSFESVHFEEDLRRGDQDFNFKSWKKANQEQGK